MCLGEQDLEDIGIQFSEQSGIRRVCFLTHAPNLGGKCRSTVTIVNITPVA